MPQAQLEIAEAAVALAARTEIGSAAIAAGRTLAQEGMAWLEGTSGQIRVRAENGIVSAISPQKFEEQFGVKYLPKLEFAPEVARPPVPKLANDSGWQSAIEHDRPAMQDEIARNLQRGFGGGSQSYGDGERKAWLYGSQIRAGHLADVFIGKVDDTVGHGLFAGDTLAPGQMIGEYTGIVRQTGRTQLERDNYYLFKYGAEHSIDAQHAGNVTRFINHSERTPNAAHASVIVDDLEHVILVATKQIERNSQILFDYGRDYWQSRSLNPLNLVGR